MIEKENCQLSPLRALLSAAERGGYAVGSFSPRYTRVIIPVLRAAEAARAPLLVQVSAIEMRRVGFSVAEFAQAFFEACRTARPTVPLGLHLDHTQDVVLIREAIEHGFTSVMIDASSLPFDENVAVTRQVVALAHPRQVAVEAELGRIASGDHMETENDDEFYTVPEEAARFVELTGVDALAVSVGTAHGVYHVRQPRIDLTRLAAIRRLTPVHLVLHGGSGVPAEMIAAAIHLPGGGVSKINIATDLELAMLHALSLSQRPTNTGLCAIPEAEFERGAAAVEAVVEDKLRNFLGSAARAGHPGM